MPRKRILIVEDDRCLYQAFHRAIKLSRKDLEVDWVTTEEEAEKALVEKPYDGILADCQLAGLRDGLDLWKHCHSRYPSIPFVMISACDFRDFFARLEGHPEPPFLSKPFRLGELVEVLNIRL